MSKSFSFNQMLNKIFSKIFNPIFKSQFRYLFILMLSVNLTSEVARSNAVGVGAQNFHPTDSGYDFVTVHSSKTIPSGFANIGFFLTYAENTLPYFSGGKEDDQTWASQMQFGIGLLDNWDMGFAIPMINDQNVNATENVGLFENSGVTEFRFLSKVRILTSESFGVAAIVSGVVDNTENFPLAGDGAGLNWNFELALDTKLLEDMAIAFNAGYRLRDEGKQIASFPTVGPLGDQWIFSVGANYQLPSINSVAISEIYTSFPFDNSSINSDKEVSSAEWLFGMKYIGFKDVDIHYGGGAQVIAGTSTPDWKVYTGFNWKFGPLWKKSEPSYQEPEERVERPITRTKPPIQEVVLVEEEEEVETIDINDFDELSETVVKKNVNYIIRNVNFEFDSDRLDSRSKDGLKKFALILKRPPELKLLTIEGHTDGKGSEDYNRLLSRRRAIAVRKFLIAQGVSAQKIKAFGYGESRPLATNETEEGRTRNRRVTFKVRR